MICRVIHLAAIMCLALALPVTLQGQVKRDTTKKPPEGLRFEPQQSVDVIAPQIEMMAPMMDQMMQATMKAALTVLSRPETVDQIATFTKRYYDALVAKGFTKEEALRIVTAHGIPIPAMR